jgi:hypothetical protein
MTVNDKKLFHNFVQSNYILMKENQILKHIKAFWANKCKMTINICSVNFSQKVLKTLLIKLSMKDLNFFLKLNGMLKHFIKERILHLYLDC